MKRIRELLAIVERIAAVAQESPGMPLIVAFDRKVGGDTRIAEQSVAEALKAISRAPSEDSRAIREALVEFVGDVDATGGLDSNMSPWGSLDWPDLGVTYLHACRALGRDPLISEDEPSG